MSPFPVTIGVLTYNSASSLGKTLSSVVGAAEIIVCDGGSTDETRSIAHAFGARIIEQDAQFKSVDGRLRDFAGVRNQIIASASQDWLFFIDSDEMLRPELISELREILRTKAPAAYWVPRKYVWKGKVIEYATTYPNVQMRFFHRHAVAGYIRAVHEKVVPLPGVPVTTLVNYMLVPLDEDIQTLKARWARYIAIEVSLKPNITFRRWLRLLLHEMKVSLIYGIRLPRVLLHSSRLPLSFELARHEYNLHLMIALLKTVTSL